MGKPPHKPTLPHTTKQEPPEKPDLEIDWDKAFPRGEDLTPRGDATRQDREPTPDEAARRETVQEVPAKPERVILRPQPPSNVTYPQVTAGIARNMQADVPEPRDTPEPTATGGGNLNGSANTANLLGHAGTGANQIAVPRQNIRIGGGNYCGIV